MSSDFTTVNLKKFLERKDYYAQFVCTTKTTTGYKGGRSINKDKTIAYVQPHSNTHINVVFTDYSSQILENRTLVKIYTDKNPKPIRYTYKD